MIRKPETRGPDRPPPAGEGTLALLAAVSLFYGLLTAFPLAASRLLPGIDRPLMIVFILASLLAGRLYWRKIRPSRPAPPESPGRAAVVFLVFTLALYAILWFLAYALPDFSYDGNYYHTPAVHFWLRAGRIHWIGTGPSPHWGPVGEFAWNGYPKGVEVMLYVFLRAAGVVRLLNSPNLLFLPLGVLAVVSISRTLGGRPGFSLVAGCLFVYLPINLAQSLTAMVDTASAACYLAAFALVLGAAGGFHSGKVPWRLAPGLAAALGLAVGSKGPAPALAAAGGVVLLARLLLHRPRPARGFRSGLLFIAAVLLAGMALGGYWMGRNWYRTGNPLYPVAVRVAGREVFPGIAVAEQFRPPYRAGTEDWSQPGRVVSSWLGCLRIGDPEVIVYDSRAGGLGFPWLLSIPAILILLVSLAAGNKRNPGTKYLPDLLFLCLVMFLAMPRHHNHMSRYTIWLAGLGLPALAVVAGDLAAGKAKFSRVAGRVWVSAAVLAALLEAAVSLDFHASLPGVFRGEEERGCPVSRAVRAARSPYPAGFYWADLDGSIFELIMAGAEPAGVAIAEKNQRHLVFGHLVQGGALGRREIVFLDHERAGTDPGYLAGLIGGAGVRYVIWDSTIPLLPFLVNDSLRQDYRVGMGLWHVFTFEREPGVFPANQEPSGI